MALEQKQRKEQGKGQVHTVKGSNLGPNRLISISLKIMGNSPFRSNDP